MVSHNLELGAEINLFSSKFFFVGVLYHSNRNETLTEKRNVCESENIIKLFPSTDRFIYDMQTFSNMLMNQGVSRLRRVPGDLGFSTHEEVCCRVQCNPHLWRLETSEKRKGGDPGSQHGGFWRGKASSVAAGGEK